MCAQKNSGETKVDQLIAIIDRLIDVLQNLNRDDLASPGNSNPELEEKSR